MKSYRLNRMFNSLSGRCFDVAIDHGFFGENSFLQGIENMQKVMEVIVQANPDAVQLTAGQAKHLQSILGSQKPALVLRTDVANVYGKELLKESFSEMMEDCVEQAVRLDAACLCVNLFQIPQAPEVTRQCIKNILRLKPLSEKFCMPVMIEPLVFQPNQEKGGYMVDGNLSKILTLVRQAVELGADVIKADPTDNIEDYHKVIGIAGGVPVLVRGGGKASDKDILQRTEQLIYQGASGIVYGRNVLQHDNPGGIVRALMSIVHEEKKALEAAEYIYE